MTVHLSARVAWHMDGWNGRVCKDPAANTYCVGHYSFPGDQIRTERRLPWEIENAGRPCGQLSDIPPCAMSINAFGSEAITGYSDPPEWYPAEGRRTWEMPPHTVGIWPYEEMYREEVRKPGQGYDYGKRLEYAKEYLSCIEPGRSLVFYYANYSNPYSEEDAPRYAIIGVSRVKTLSQIRNYDNMTAEDRARYGGGFVWSVDLTSHYPDEGLRLPYHLYADEPEKAERFLITPPNPRDFKYATRQFADDEALELVERFIESVNQLIEMGDTSEDWPRRLTWLYSLVGELWHARGLYPGMAGVLSLMHVPELIPWFRDRVEQGAEKEAYTRILSVLDGSEDPPSALLTDADTRALRRRWRLLEDTERRLIGETLARFDLPMHQLERLLSPDRQANGVAASLTDLHTNPYLMAEQFVGDDADDLISFTKIDHGMLPSPELGGRPLADPDDARRLRALCVERLKSQQADVFVAAERLIHEVNHRLSFHPEWKRHQFTERYLEADRDLLEDALVIRAEQGARWVYLRSAYEDERTIEQQSRALHDRADITLRTPMTEAHWKEYLRDPSSALATRAGDAYNEAITDQAEVCARIFRRPLCVLAGEAGTGKTTMVQALLKAVERTEGAGASFQLLAPTGKAAERLRERTGRRAQTSTVHSFLARNGWLNPNLTLKQHGGRREDAFATYVIDECSMLSLELFGALVRAINWNSVRRLILVGDPSQLPPIGRGKAFADIIDWLRPLSGVGELTINVRQMENRARDRGTAILELADAYRRRHPAADQYDPLDAAGAESILRRVQLGGDVDKDLRVHFWRDGDDLQAQLIDLVVADAEADTSRQLDDQRPWEFWKAAFNDYLTPERSQVLTPYRGEVYGTEILNDTMQAAIHQRPVEELRSVDGIALNDKVIQIRNRPPSRAIWAYNWSTRKTERIEVYNGEMGFAQPHAFDSKKLTWAKFRPEKLQVKFSTKPDYAVGFGRGLGRTADGKWMPAEPVEENLELGYAVSIHKAQGSEFDRVYFVVPKHRTALLSRELFYTGLTRAARHCTLLIEEDISPLLSMRRLEKSRLLAINTSLFDFRPVPDELRRPGDWYTEGRIHSTLSEYMVRSKSEVIIANMLFARDIPFEYETPLYAPDGTFYLPDFTLTVAGQTWYWEHLGLLHDEGYSDHWETKQQWYELHFPGQLLTTTDSGELSREAAAILDGLT